MTDPVGVGPVAHPRRLRFAVEMKGPFPGRSWADSARRLEDMGYSALVVPDHVGDGLGPLTALATAAAATTTLRVGTMVLAADFRHPALLAQELATLDVVSGGRLEVGIGAGWQRRDYATTGVTFDPPAVRVARLLEYATVLRGLWSPGPFSFTGRHYRIDDLTGVPRPVTPGGPPLLMAGGGRRVLSGAARHADIVGVNRAMVSGVVDAASARDGLPAAVDRKLVWVREAAGPRWPALELNAWVSVTSVTRRPEWLAARLAAAWQADAEDILASPFTLVGPEEALVDALHQRRERWGFSYYVVTQDAAHALAPVVARVTGT